jgi:dihydroneopterin aldolase
VSVDLIIVPEIPLRARVGVTEQERGREQEVRVDVELRLELTRAGREDALEHTVDYESVCDVVASTVQSRPYHVIEAVAEACAAALLAAFSVDEVRVRVRKPGALRARGVPYAAVEVVRRRA